MTSFATLNTARTVRSLLRDSARALEQAGVAAPRLDAEVLLAEALQGRREDLVARPDRVLDADEAARFQEYVERRRQREPVAYILGRKEFWSMEFAVSPDVLIPRPASECILRRLLMLVETCGASRAFRILDLGTGSGNLAVAAARQFPQAEVVAVDISSRALEIAKRNAHKHGVADRVHFQQGDAFNHKMEWSGLFHYIISNPPYIRREAVAGLVAEASDYEPAQAFDGGPDGLMFYETIIPLALKYLHRAGHLVVEIGDDQKDDVVGLFDEAGTSFKIEVLKDYDGKDRVVSAMRTDSRG